MDSGVDLQRKEERRLKREERKRKRRGAWKRLKERVKNFKPFQKLAYLLGIVLSGYTGPIAKWLLVLAALGGIAFVAWNFTK